VICLILKRTEILLNLRLMIKNFKDITPILLLLVFLLPSIEKLEHHHKHSNHNLINDEHYPEFRENCYICDFEFSVFSSDLEAISIQKEQYIDNYSNRYSSFDYSNHSTHSFLLRAPPYNLI